MFYALQRASGRAGIGLPGLATRSVPCDFVVLKPQNPSFTSIILDKTSKT